MALGRVLYPVLSRGSRLRRLQRHLRTPHQRSATLILVPVLVRSTGGRGAVTGQRRRPVRGDGVLGGGQIEPAGANQVVELVLDAILGLATREAGAVVGLRPQVGLGVVAAELERDQMVQLIAAPLRVRNASA